MKSLGIVDLLLLGGFDPAMPTKMVRHQDVRYPVRELLRNGWLETYQGYQSRPVFHNVDYVVVFHGLTGHRACFYGVFRKLDVIDAKLGPIPADCAWGREWQEGCKYYYELERVAGFEALEDRVVIDWGRAALAWHQKLTNKAVLEITPKGRRLPPFDDYLDFTLGFAELKELFAHPDAHREWRARLEAVAGVYLVLAEASGDMYVGSATGAGGIWARWSDYASTGHGSNKHLKKLVAENPVEYPARFRFSVLQILPKTTAESEVIRWEGIYKGKLGTRATGLNLN